MKLRIPLTLKRKLITLACVTPVLCHSDEPVSTIEDIDGLSTAVNNGGSYVLNSNLVLAQGYVLTQPSLNINLRDNAINLNNTNSSFRVEYGSMLELTGGTIRGFQNVSTPVNAALVNEGNTILNDMIFLGNKSYGAGVAITNRGTQSNTAIFIMNGGRIADNTSVYGMGRGYGTGFYNAGVWGFDVRSIAEFNGVSFVNNINEQGYGGAICNGNEDGAANLTLRDCIFDGNGAKELNASSSVAYSSVGGGAIANIFGTVTVIDSSFKNNYSDMGGAIINRYYMTIRAENSDVVFTNNQMVSNWENDSMKGANDIYLNSTFSHTNYGDQYAQYFNHTFLEAAEGRRIVFNGGIRGLNNNFAKDDEGKEIIDEQTGRNIALAVPELDNVVLINQSKDGIDYTGTVVFEKTAVVQSINITLYNGTMVVADGEVFYNGRDRFDPIKDRDYVRYRSNFSLQGGTLDLSRLLTGTFSVEKLTLGMGTVNFGTTREYNTESLITGTYGWAGNESLIAAYASPQIVFHVNSLRDYNKDLDYVLLDYVNNALTDNDLQYFSLSADQYGDGWGLVVVEGDLVLHYSGDGRGTDSGTEPVDPVDPLEPIDPTDPPVTIDPSERIDPDDLDLPGGPEVSYPSNIADNSLWTSDSNLRSMGAGVMDQLNIFRLRHGPNRNLWAKGLGDFARQDSHGGIDGYQYNGGGYSAGLDNRFDNLGYLGIAFGQIWGENKSRDYTGNVKQRSIMGTVYGGKLFERADNNAWLVKAAATYGDTDNRMNVLYPDNTYSHGKWNNKSWFLQAEVSYRIDQENGWVLAPFVGIEYSHSSRDSFDDSGSPINNWYYESAKLQRITLPVGLQIDNLSKLGNKPWLNTFKIAYVGDAYRDNPNSAAYYGGTDAAWEIRAANPSRNAIRAEYYTSVMLNDQWQIYAGYSFEGHDRSVYHHVNAGVSYAF